MEKITIPQAVKQYLKSGQLISGGIISEDVGHQLQKKSSNVERRLREMENDGVLAVEYHKINGKGADVSFYRLKLEGQAKLF